MVYTCDWIYINDSFLYLDANVLVSSFTLLNWISLAYNSKSRCDPVGLVPEDYAWVCITAGSCCCFLLRNWLLLLLPYLLIIMSLWFVPVTWSSADYLGPLQFKYLLHAHHVFRCSYVWPRTWVHYPGHSPLTQDIHLRPRTFTSDPGHSPPTQDIHLRPRTFTSDPGHSPPTQDIHLRPRTFTSSWLQSMPVHFVPAKLGSDPGCHPCLYWQTNLIVQF
jgi:hypothetical protein